MYKYIYICVCMYYISYYIYILCVCASVYPPSFQEPPVLLCCIEVGGVGGWLTTFGVQCVMKRVAMSRMFWSMLACMIGSVKPTQALKSSLWIIMKFQTCRVQNVWAFSWNFKLCKLTLLSNIQWMANVTANYDMSMKNIFLKKKNRISLRKHPQPMSALETQWKNMKNDDSQMFFQKNQMEFQGTSSLSPILFYILHMLVQHVLKTAVNFLSEVLSDTVIIDFSFLDLFNVFPAIADATDLDRKGNQI